MSQQQKSPYEDIILFLIICGLVAVIAWGIWFFFHAQLTWIVKWVRVGELWLVTLLYGENYTVFDPDVGTQVAKTWRDGFTVAPVSEIELNIVPSTYIAVLPLRLLFAILIGVMAILTIFFGPGTKYNRRLSLETLIKEQAKAFPGIAPFIKFDPRKLQQRVLGQAVPDQLPLFAEALSPEEWIAFHEIQVKNGQLDLNKAWQALALQLGPRWQGPLKLPLHAQGLYAAFALRHVRKRRESEELLDQLSLAWTPEKGLNLPFKVRMQIHSIIKDPKLGGTLQKHADKHAYVTTALLRCLARAREEGGVLAPATFLWLRGQDRALWYPLNNLGRRSYHAEGVGALVHYTNELIAGQKIPTPRFEEVIKGFEAMLRGPGARPIPPLEKKGKRSAQ